ncbi:endoribonuclease LACTB2-like [Sycon ciliatum]|uniref:endoribonuclease LACTB2-like n=1 Tax=Sycon ciliatum TaxID=27933 RepID=UPI0020A8A74B|eukprot:scpid75259/ scgid13177/ Beta-lactamase-like protein 2
MALAALPNLERLSSRVVRVLGLNPGPMTLQGTNTYLVGKGKQRLLIDTGEGKADYPALLRKSMDGCEIKHVVLTHWHHDHVGGVADVSRLQPNVSFWKMPAPDHDRPITSTSGETSQLVPVETLRDTDTFNLDDGETSLRVIHTPGHTTDHVALYLEQENAVFSGDCVLGGSTAVFENLYDYMKSLAKLVELKPGRIYPGHGPVIEESMPLLEQYIAHRNQREEQILACVRSEARPWTAMDIVKVVYTTTPESLYRAAEKNVMNHLLKLQQQGDIAPSQVADDGSERWISKL